jgi:pimeloyl-ACP methyl ester carboxylesterase
MAGIFGRCIALWLLLAPAPAAAEAWPAAPRTAEARAPVVLIYNHGTDRPQERHSCDEAQDVPAVVRDISAANGWTVRYLCSQATDGGVAGSYTYKRADEILDTVRGLREQGVPARHIFLLGQSAGGWSSLMAARKDHSGFNAIVAFAPAFAGPRHEMTKYPWWRNELQPRQIGELAAAARIEALIFAYDDDTFDRPRELAPLALVRGVRIVAFNRCGEGHGTAHGQCFRQGARRLIEDYIRARLAGR